MIDAQRLAETADAMLRLIERDSSAPHYIEESFARKVKDSNRRAAELPPIDVAGAEGELLRSSWQDVLERAGLTPAQRCIAMMRLEGYSFVEIGAKRGHSKQAAQQIWSVAREKLTRAWARNPYRDLHEVYAEETRRRLHRLPRVRGR